MNQKEKRKARKTFDERNHEIMVELWGEKLESIPRWCRKTNDGFVTIPRWLALVNRILDKLSNGKPLSSTYLSLWFRSNDDAFVHIKDEKMLAIESGFDSERATSTWKQRMKLLKELGFIEVKAGDKSDYQYVIIKEPYSVVLELGDKIQEKYRMTLLERMKEVGA
ncbi:hypothetical protein [Avibacterium paragallinarum]|uniref:Uncharacterized protein n=1 Tax=Avibacterium paragallinarum TaxID=728 RepID=A0ABU7QSQ5_AVIPA|nr:hypothetical protein [Avibacterium paragallinarum]